MTALAKDPHQRFSSIQAFVTAFGQACEQGVAGADEHYIRTQVSPTRPVSNPGLYPAHDIAPPPPVYTPPPPPVQYMSGQIVTPPGAAPSRPQQRSQASFSSISTPPPVPVARPAKSQGRKGLYTILAIFVLIVLAIAVPLIIANSNSSTTTAGPNFRQISTTSADVTTIAVGTGYTSGSVPDNVSATFHPGDTIYLVCSITHVGASISDTLSVGSTSVSTSGGLTDHTDSVFYDYATVQLKGVYTWKVTYIRPDGTQQASITFQVI